MRVNVPVAGAGLSLRNGVPAVSEGVWRELAGQEAVVAQLSRAAAGAAAVLAGERAEPGVMTHAWLFTGPPGSGRSVAARAFAAALLCPNGGDGTCPSCHQVQAGTHADLMLVRPDGLSYGVKQTRSLVLRAAGAPSGGRWCCSKTPTAPQNRPPTPCSRPSRNPPRGPSGCCARRRRKNS